MSNWYDGREWQITSLRGLIGRNVKNLRKAKGWNQRTLAEHWGSQPIVSDTETGKRNLTVAEIFALARVLEVSVFDLYPESERNVLKYGVDHPRLTDERPPGGGG